MTVDTILNDLEAMGQESTKKILMKHGAREPLFGVKVEHLKKIAKKIGKNYELSMALYQTGNADAMYLAGIISDALKMSETDLNVWAQGAYWHMISEYPVAWTASEHPEAFKLALTWIESPEEAQAVSGWATLADLVSLMEDNQLELNIIEHLMDRISEQIHEAEDRRKYTMNTFLIAVGAYVKPLHQKAMKIASGIGKLDYKLHGTACKVPLASEYILKALERNPDFKKKKTARC